MLSTAMLAIMMVVFYVSAGRIDIPQSWFLFSVIFVYFEASNIALYRYNPELLIQRLKIRRKGSKTWDEVLMRLTNLTALLLVPAVAGLDVGRYQLSSLGLPYSVVGVVSLIVSSVLINWAMIENPYFEPTVRIQDDRDHRVVTTGPYAIVRHPGYLSGILWLASVPLILGSLYAFAPYVLYAVLITLRTYLEDRTLREELRGYTEYAERVRYRLVPWIW
ncbi:MAG: isoprenylcysteine carboxylmethyltransferase family protein [Candidatus Bathyarchaeota archaeon]|nr:isoprenylcysteine carboxylmethyltransferase family protein [Candidatus Bathyarchaeota archaeon]